MFNPRPRSPEVARAVRAASRSGGFTLLELILVLGLLLIVVGISLPSLRGFMASRNLDHEARRFLSLTRFAQARAAAEGVPMVLWVDAQEGTYGLQAEVGYLDDDRKAIEYAVDEGLNIEASAPAVTTSPITGQRQAPRTVPVGSQLPAIRISPDGFFGETSPETIVLQQANREEAEAVWITQSGNRLHYEIRDTPPLTWSR